MINDYSVLVLGCKKHEEIADRFFKLADIFWPEILEKVMFCTDEMSYFQKSFSRNSIVEESSSSFKSRIEKGLQEIKTKYVLLLLDDYYLTKRIDDDLFSNLINDLNNNDIVYCKLIGLPKCFKSFRCIKSTYRIKQKTHYGISLQPSIWEVKYLKEALALCSGVTAWEVEAAFNLFQEKYYNKCLTFNKNYLSIKNGVLRGRLFPYTNRLLKKNKLPQLSLKRISYARYWSFTANQHLAMHIPILLRKFFKKIGKKLGAKYYSED